MKATPTCPWTAPRRTMPDRACRILVLAPNWLGDAVMASPLVSRLAASRDAAGRPPEIHLAVRSTWRSLFESDPRLAGLVAVDRGGRHGGVGGVGRLAHDLRAVGADAIVLGPPSLRAGLVAALARVPVRVGYAGDGRSPLLTHRLRRPARGARHHADELLDLGDAALAALDLAAGELAAERALGALSGAASHVGSDGSPPVWVFAPGTTYGEAKVWPRDRAAEFTARAVTERGVRLVLLGDAAAGPLAAALAEGRAAGPQGPGVDDRTGRTTVAEAAAVLAGADAFVGNDSGLMHLAAAMGVPTVGLFGSTNPAWTAPRGRRTAVVAAEGFACRPCYRRTCNNDVFCLATVGADAVLAAIDQLVSPGGGHGDLA